jgi:hypothetical protein
MMGIIHGEHCDTAFAILKMECHTIMRTDDLLYPDRLERWFLERFRLRASLRSAWDAVRVLNERDNVTIKKLRKEIDIMRQNLPLEDLKRLSSEGKIDRWNEPDDTHLGKVK